MYMGDFLGTNQGSQSDVFAFLQEAAEDTLLTPRFYTTDFDEMDKLFNLDLNKDLPMEEFEAMLNEFKTDYNQKVRLQGFWSFNKEALGPCALFQRTDEGHAKNNG